MAYSRAKRDQLHQIIFAVIIAVLAILMFFMGRQVASINQTAILKYSKQLAPRSVTPEPFRTRGVTPEPFQPQGVTPEPFRTRGVTPEPF